MILKQFKTDFEFEILVKVPPALLITLSSKPQFLKFGACRILYLNSSYFN